MYNFEKIIDRSGTWTVKQELLPDYFGRRDLLPLWVADMDFETPPFIMDALRKRLEHPVLGYTVAPESYWQAVINWQLSRHGWSVRKEWLSFIPGIVKGIGMVINVFTNPGDKIIVQPPVYHPFRLVPEGNGREVVMNPLVEQPDGTYRMDFNQLDRVANEHCKVLILSNPHNPAGILWDRSTLERLAHFCHERGILVISDEIHADMALWGLHHIPFATVSAEAAACSITFGAPSKTFNIAGVVSSFAVVPDEHLRQRFFSWLEANEMNAPTLFAPIATMAAFSADGEAWRRELITYLEGNVMFVEQFCRERLPQIRPFRPQASFLVWLDCRRLGLDHEALNDLFVNQARLALNDGEMFGIEGRGFMRLNVGCPRAVLQQALTRLEEALN